MGTCSSLLHATLQEEGPHKADLQHNREAKRPDAMSHALLKRHIMSSPLRCGRVSLAFLSKLVGVVFPNLGLLFAVFDAEYDGLLNCSKLSITFVKGTHQYGSQDR